jgi:hypothetical protein
MVQLRASLLELVPLTSQKPGAIPGKFRDEVTLEHYDSITVVPLNISRERLMFPPYGSGNNKPICKSYDGIVPSPWVENPPARTCEACLNSKWGKKDPQTGKSKRPACDEGFKMTVIIKESQLPRIIKFKGTGITALKAFMERLETDRVQTNSKEGRKPNLFEYYFTISSQKVIKPGQISYIPMFTDVKRVSDPNMFGPFYEQYVVHANSGINEYEEDPIDTAVDQIGIAGTVEPEVVQAEFVDA